MGTGWFLSCQVESITAPTDNPISAGLELDSLRAWWGMRHSRHATAQNDVAAADGGVADERARSFSMTEPSSPQHQAPMAPATPISREVGGDTAADVPPQQHDQRWHHPQLAPRHAERHSDDAEWQDGQGSDVAVTGHDIRMKEFKRAFVRGYAADDVDTFLMYLAVEMDRRERYYRALTLDEALPTPVRTTSAPALDDELFDYPWIYAVEVGYWYLNEQEAARMRDQIEKLKKQQLRSPEIEVFTD